MRSVTLILVLMITGACSSSNSDEPQEPSTTVTWSEVGDIQITPREDGVAAISDGIVYMGYGKNEDNQLLNDFWALDPIKLTWEELNGQSTNKREQHLFDINGRLFLIADQQLSDFDFFEYNKTDDVWESRSTFTKEGVSFATAAFGANGKGYFIPTDGASVWEYDPVSDEWQKKSPIPGLTSRDSELFLLDGKAYIYGLTGNLAGKVYVYDPQNDSWETVVTEGGPTVESGFASVSVQGLGYVVMGGTVTTDAMGNPQSSTITGQVWEYDSDRNQWTQKGDFPGRNRTRMISFYSESAGFIASGFDSNRNFLKDLWTVNVIK